MRNLLDECVDQRLRLQFAEHDCQTSWYAKLSGLKNGALLAAADAAGFDVIVTILCARTNRLADRKRLVPSVLAALRTIRSGQVIRLT